MRGSLLFAAGLIAGILIMQPGQAQPDRIPGLRLNHVGVFAKNFDESYNFYTKTMGFREAFSFRTRKGNQRSPIFRSVATRSWNWRPPTRITPRGSRTLASRPTI